MKKELNLLAFIVIVLISIFFHAKDFSWLFSEWRTNPYYQHGFYVLGASLLFAGYRYTTIDWTRVGSKGPFWFLGAIFWWGISAILYWAGKAFVPENIHHYLRTLGFIFMMRGLVSFQLRERVAKNFSFPIFYPILAIPFPHFDKISVILRDGTMYASTWVFSAFGVSSYRLEESLVVKSIVLPIDSAFSGIESLILLTTLIVLLVYVTHMRDLAKGIIAGLVFPLAFLGCCVRVLVFLSIGYFASDTAALTYWKIWSTPTFYAASFLFIGLAWFFVKRAVPLK